MKKYTLSSIVVASIVGVTMFTGCGSSSSTPVDTTSTVSGQGLAAYIKGGNAFIDCDKDGQKDSGELSVDTNETGHFTITGEVCADYDIVILGGTNSATGLTMKYPTVAPKGFTKVSPLTTMLASLTATERTQLKTDLNVTDEELNTDYNTAPSGSITQAQISKVAAIKSLVETALTTSTSIDNVKTVATSFKAAVIAAKGTSSTPIDFTSDSNLTSLITSFKTELTTNNIDVNTSLDNQKDTIITIAESNSTDALETALNTAEQTNANAIANEDDTISSVGVTTVSLGNNTNISVINRAFDANITATSSIDSLFPISIGGLTVSKTFSDQNVSISAEIKDVDGNIVTLAVNGVTISGNINNTSTITIPLGTEVVFTANAGLSNLVTAMGNTRLTTATNTEKSYTNTATLEFTDITNRLTSERRAAILTALTNYFQIAKNYTVTLKVTGQASTVYIPTVVGTIRVQNK